jgi:ppGpp synthetase/RelA/SpoT-type nucleotidyltranferase
VHRYHDSIYSAVLASPDFTMTTTFDPLLLKRHVDDFTACRDRYKSFTTFLESEFRKALKSLGIESDVKARTKEVPSFAEKILRKKYIKPFEQMTDLAGVRIITHTKADARKVSLFIRRHFFIDEANSHDAARLLRVGEFGYRAVHYVLQLSENTNPPPPYPHKPEFHGLKAEVQVRTIPEHCWAEIGHDRLYKSAFSVPDRWQREFATIAALLESVDEAFTRVAEGLAAYEASYGGFIRDWQIREELAILSPLLEMEPHNEQLAHQVARLRLCLGEWGEVIQLVRRFTGPTARLLLCAGLARWQEERHTPKQGHAEGLAYLERAYAIDREDAQLGGRRNVEIIATLADALASTLTSGKAADSVRVGNLYREAATLDPDHPRVLVGQFQYHNSQEPHDLPDPTLLESLLDRAVRRCQDQIEVGVNLPWAYYSLGELFLLGRKLYECLNAYAKAIQCSPSAFMLETALESVDRLSGARSLQAIVPLVRRLLLLGLAARFKQPLAAELHPSTGERLHGPVVIVAGGCDRAVQDRMMSYQPLFREAFKDFRGTIISGGTRDGICGLVADLARQSGPTIQAVTYAPRNLPGGVELDEAYQRRQAGEEGFGPEQPLQNWIDILTADIQPSEVRLIGVNGGALASFEYRLALSLGATIGVIEESGRAADTLVRDVEWQSMKELLRLPADAMTVWNYLRTPAVSSIADDHVELLARLLHMRYLAGQQQMMSQQKPTLQPWEKLDKEFQDSNRKQASHLLSHLQRIHIEAYLSGPDEPLLELTTEEKDELAQMEHGRWNLEKLHNGWKFGPVREDENRIHPLLRPWEQLPEDVKNQNRDTAGDIPKLLRTIGLGLRRLPGSLAEESRKRARG